MVSELQFHRRLSRVTMNQSHQHRVLQHVFSISLCHPFRCSAACSSRCFLCSAWTSSSINSSSNSSSNSRSCSFSRCWRRACACLAFSSVSASNPGCLEAVASGSELVPFKRSSRLLTPKSPRMHCSWAACVSSSISSSSNNSSNSLSASRAWARARREPLHLTDWKPFGKAPTRPPRAMATPTARSILALRFQLIWTCKIPDQNWEVQGSDCLLAFQLIFGTSFRSSGNGFTILLSFGFTGGKIPFYSLCHLKKQNSGKRTTQEIQVTQHGDNTKVAIHIQHETMLKVVLSVAWEAKTLQTNCGFPNLIDQQSSFRYGTDSETQHQPIFLVECLGCWERLGSV